MDDQTTQPDEELDEANVTDVEEVKEEMDVASQMIDLEKTIKTFHASIMMKRTEMKDLKSSVKDALQNDQSYMQEEEKIKEVKMLQEKVKEQIMALSSIIQTKEEIKDLTDEIKHLQDMLSKNLVKYYEITKQNTITMTDGQTYEIKQSLSLVKQSSKYKP